VQWVLAQPAHLCAKILIRPQGGAFPKYDVDTPITNAAVAQKNLMPFEMTINDTDPNPTNIIWKNFVSGIALPELHGCSSTELVPPLADAERLDRGYLFHWLRQPSIARRLMERHTGARMPRADMDVLLGMDLPLPPLEEQRQIVALLRQAAEIRRRADGVREKARALIPALFLDIFGDPATNPKGWPVITIGEVIERITGGKNVQAGDGVSPYRIMKVSAVTSGRLKPEQSKPAPNIYTPDPDHFVRRGDFLFSRANTGELIGAVAIATDPPPGLLLPDKIWRIEWNLGRVNPHYAYSLLRSTALRRVFGVIASGTSDSMKNISQAKLNRVVMMLPPIDVQSEFGGRVDRIERLSRALDDATRKAEAVAAAVSAEVFGTESSRNEAADLTGEAEAVDRAAAD
jgi:type I restriction enzyme, S subunit